MARQQNGLKTEENAMNGENAAPEDESTTDNDLVEEFDAMDIDSSDSDNDSVVFIEGYSNRPIRFVFGEQAELLDAIAYGLNESGFYFLVDKDGAEISGLLVDAFIRRCIRDGLLSPINSISTEGTNQIIKQEVDGKHFKEVN